MSSCCMYWLLGYPFLLLLPLKIYSLDTNSTTEEFSEFFNVPKMDDSGMSKKHEEMCHLGATSDFISNLPDNDIDAYAYVDGEPYDQLPTCFFSVQQISTLELGYCLLKKPPPTFTGFSNLKSLCLYEPSFVDKGGFECLISKCPLLERLTLDITYYGIDHLNISSHPNLKYLCLYGTFQDICFENTPLLSDVSIRLSRAAVEKFLHCDQTGNVVKVLSSLPNLEKFEMGGVFPKFSSLSKIPEKLTFTCHHLNNLTLTLNFEDVNDICVTLCLLNSAPNLQELEIESCSFCNLGQDIENFWEERTLIDWNMSKLQIVKITNIERFNLELEFIKMLLANSPMLEMLTIIISYDFDIHDCKGLEILKELLIFPRASPKAKIKFLNS